MRNWTKKTILATRGLRFAAELRSPSAAILMYHSVLPDPNSGADTLGGIIHSEAAFRGQMELLSRDYHPISLDQLMRHLRPGDGLPKRAVVVTFDDGYADNYEFAMPVLNHFGVPAAFYLTAQCMEQRKLPWPSRLRFAFLRTKLRSWADSSSKTWNFTDRAQREEAFLAACEICCQKSGHAQEDYVSRIEDQLEMCASAENLSMLTYEQAGDLVRRGHIVGSHTMTHPNMAHVTQDDAHREFAESKRHLESRLSLSIRHFSYPCPALSPHWNERTMEQCRAVGYESAVTTDSRLVCARDNLLCLPRIRPTKTVEGLRWNLECAFAGRAV